MANSVVTATGDGVTVQYTLNFTLGILRRDYVTCRVGSEVDGAGNPVYRTLEWVSDSIVNIQGTVPANGESIVFTRTVPKNLLIHDYSNGVPVEESNLDESNLQTIMAVHEFLDGRIEGGFVQDMQMNGYKIVNLGDGVADTDAANMRQLNETTTAANAAVASTAAAVTTCTTKASEASASATESENWATKTDGIVESTDYSSKAFAIGGTGVTDTAGRGAAKEWATKDEDSTVDTSEYSAKHYAAKAAASSAVSATRWAFDTSTTMDNPGTGEVRLNNATVSSVTQIAVSANNAEAGNPDISDYIAQWDDGTSTVKGYLYIKKSGSPENYAIFQITGTITDNTTWLQIPVTYVSSSGSFSASNQLYFYFVAKGDAGSFDTITADIDMNGNQLQLSKGADVASASALAVGTDGNYFDVTGTTTITSINTSGGAGTVIKLHFDEALTLTHHATDLILPGGANITTAAGDEAEFVEYAAGNYRCTTYTKADGTSVVSAGAGLVLAHTETISSSVAQVDIEETALFDGTYKELVIVGVGLTPASGASQLNMRVKVGGTYQTSNYSSSAHDSPSNGGHNVYQDYNDVIVVPKWKTPCTYMDFKMHTVGLNNGSSYPLYITHGDEWGDNSQNGNSYAAGRYKSATSITGMRFYFTGVNITNGELQFWGMKA